MDHHPLVSEKQKNSSFFETKTASKSQPSSKKVKSIHLGDSILDKKVNLSTINEAKTAYKKRGVIVLKGIGGKPEKPEDSENLTNEVEIWDVNNSETQIPFSKKEFKKDDNRITLIEKAPTFEVKGSNTNQLINKNSKNNNQLLAETQSERSIDVKISVNDSLPIHSSKTKQLKPNINPPPNITSSDIRISVNDDLSIGASKRVR